MASRTPTRAERGQRLAALVLLFDRSTTVRQASTLADMWWAVPAEQRNDPELAPARPYAPRTLREQWKSGRTKSKQSEKGGLHSAETHA